jgi:hypothetical protein
VIKLSAHEVIATALVSMICGSTIFAQETVIVTFEPTGTVYCRGDEDIAFARIRGSYRLRTVGPSDSVFYLRGIRTTSVVSREAPTKTNPPGRARTYSTTSMGSGRPLADFSSGDFAMVETGSELVWPGDVSVPIWIGDGQAPRDFLGDGDFVGVSYLSFWPDGPQNAKSVRAYLDLKLPVFTHLVRTEEFLFRIEMSKRVGYCDDEEPVSNPILRKVDDSTAGKR